MNHKTFADTCKKHLVTPWAEKEIVSIRIIVYHKSSQAHMCHPLRDCSTSAGAPAWRSLCVAFGTAGGSTLQLGDAACMLPIESH